MKAEMDYEFFEAQEKDLNAVSALVNSAYRGESSRAGWTTEADFLGGQRTDPETLAYNLRQSSNRKIVGYREKASQKVVACVYLERLDDSRGPLCYLGMLTVLPTLQTAGLGKKLMTEAENFAKKWGAVRMTLNVIHLRAELMAWYERRGYKKTGETKSFPYGDPKAGDPLRDDLHFILFEKKLV